MHTLRYLRAGFQIAARHKRLVIALWLVPLVPALVLGALAAANLGPHLGQSLFADQTLDGGGFIVFQEFRSSPADSLDPIFGRGVIVMALLTLMLQVMLSAGVVETLIERRPENPFVLGIRRNLLSFLRTTGVLVPLTGVVIILCRLLAKGFFKIAEIQSDGRFDLAGAAAAAVLFVVLWGPLDLAADLSRIAAARHDDRSMVRGFFRAWWTVVRSPGLIPMYLAFLLLPLILHAVYGLLRSPWTPGTAVAILVLLLLQQAVMLVRAFIKLGFWGAEVAAYREFGEPRWCRKQSKKAPIEAQGEVVEAI